MKERVNRNTFFNNIFITTYIILTTKKNKVINISFSLMLMNIREGLVDLVLLDVQTQFKCSLQFRQFNKK